MTPVGNKLQAAADSRRLVSDFLKHLARTRATNTVYCYGKDLESYVGHLDKTHVLQASVQDMYAWVDRPRTKARGVEVAPATVRREMMVLRSFYTYLTDQADLLARNPAMKLTAPKVNNELPHPVPEETWTAFWRRGDVPDDLRVACGLAYFGGLRRHEVTLLRPSQFGADGAGRLVIFDMKRKGHRTKTHPAPFPLGSCVAMYAERLEHLIGPPESFLGPLERLLAARRGEPTLLPWDGRDSRYATRTKWERPESVIDPLAFNRRLTRMSAGFAPHDLRHSFCTNMVRPRPQGCGVPLQIVAKLASHSDPRITMRYLDIGADPLADLLDGGDDGIVGQGRWG